MNLKNKDIAEGMRVTNGKNELKVVTWDKSYNDCLLNYIDSKGTRYVVAQNYKLSGTSEDPQISWMNGRYFTANSDDEAFEEYLDYLGEVNGYDISESLTEENKEVVRARINLDGNEDLMNLFAEEEIYDSTKYDYSYEELAKATKKLFGKVGKDFDWDFTNKNTIIITTKKYGDFEILPLNRDLEQVSLFSFFMDGEFKEGKKSSRKSLKESAKPINEKNVAKFVDELNNWVDDNVNFADVEQAQFTKEYGKLYNFGYRLDYSYSDKGDLLVFDEQGTLDWYEDELVVPFIKKLAKNYGWYCEPAHSYADFTFGEL